MNLPRSSAPSLESEVRPAGRGRCTAPVGAMGVFARRAAMLGALSAALWGAGCSLVNLPQAQSDPTKFYVLSVPPAEHRADAAMAPVVRLRPIELASYLRARPMIVRTGPNELQFRDFARWGEPLEQGVGRVLREELLQRGAARAVDASGVRSPEAGEVKYEITVRVLACEGDTDGRINFDAAWEISGMDPHAAAPVRGEYRPTDLKWSPRHEASLAAALSTGVAGLAAQIGDALAQAK